MDDTSKPKHAKKPIATDMQVKHISQVGRHKVVGVTGLYLRVRPNGSKLWELRKQSNGKRQDFALGSYPTVMLAQAREKATLLEADLIRGINPKQAKKEQKEAEKQKKRTFADEVILYIDNKKSEWRSQKTLTRWRGQLQTYANPVIGNLPLQDITPKHILDILRPIWESKTETARRVQSGIAAVLDWANARERYRETSNPAAWQGHLKNILPDPKKVNQTEHHPSVPCSQAHAFMQALMASNHRYKEAVAFTVLNAVRSGDTRGMTWAEIDHSTQTWTIPEGRLKVKFNGKHRVPLSRQAYAIIERQRQAYIAEYNTEPNPQDFVFCNTKGGAVDENALNSVVKKIGFTDAQGATASLHGFRSTFKEWASETTRYPNELSEMALAHAIKNKVEAAYRRGDMLDKRRPIMQDYADLLDAPFTQPQ